MQKKKLFVLLTSCSPPVSASACLMKKEKRRRRWRRTRDTILSLSASAAHTGYLICPSLWKRHTQSERERERLTGGRGAAAAEKSEVVPPFPVTRETNALSKGNRPMANTGNCAQTKSHMTAKTPLPGYGVETGKRERGRKLGGWRLIKR